LLDRGLAQASRVSALQREEANLLGRVGELSAAEAQAAEQITEIEIEVLSLDTTRREEAITRLRDLQFNELELSERQRTLTEQLNRLDIRAPVSGIVYGLQVFAERSVIEATMRFSAFDQRRTPELFGTVTLISADAFQDDSAVAPFYRVELRLNDGEMKRLPEDMTLIPGMPVESFVRTADRSPMDYLIKPLSDYFAKAFRES